MENANYDVSFILFKINKKRSTSLTPITIILKIEDSSEHNEENATSIAISSEEGADDDTWVKFIQVITTNVVDFIQSEDNIQFN